MKKALKERNSIAWASDPGRSVTVRTSSPERAE
jgi:hypothetical protein